MAAGSDIVIVLFQYSVVVKGIERRLSELGYHVTIVSEKYHLITEFGKTTSLFLLYMPGEVFSDKLTMRRLGEIFDMVHLTGKNMVILGERKDHEDLSAEFPTMDDFVWLDRPVDAETLGEEVEKAIATPAKKAEQKHVLIVDDDPSYASMVREWIKGIYRTDIVTAGMQAITFCTRNKVDLVLLDYEMPIVDGPQLLQMLRQDDSTKNIPVVFLTGVGTKEGVERVMELRPDGYVLKSTTRENLLGYLRKLLG